MALKEMYPAINNSVPALLTALLSATATTIPLSNAALLPDGPNIATLGMEDNAELVYYTAVTDNHLTGCVRGYAGTVAQIWPEHTAVYRAYTAVDHHAFLHNLQTLQAQKLDITGDASALRPAYDTAPSRANLLSGETLSESLAKLRRWYLDLGPAAWAEFGATPDTVAPGDHTHDAYLALDAHGKAAPSALSARLVTVTASRALSLTDAGCCLDATASSPLTLTIPTHQDVPFPIDTEIEIAWEGPAQVTIAAASGVTLASVKGAVTASGLPLMARYAVAALKKKADNSWRVTGEIA